MNEILIIEDKDSLRQMLKEALEENEFLVDEAKNGAEAIQKIKAQKYFVILSDLKIPHVEGLEILLAAKEADPDNAIIYMTAYGSIEIAVEAMKKGAYDFLPKPVDINHLLLLVKRIQMEQQLRYENMLLKEEYSKRLGFPRIIGEDPVFKEVAVALQKAAPRDTTVLIMGESGTGKELFARAIHQLSPRKNAPFVAISCAAIPETLLENELFGHEKGAFTGANNRKLGKFELAHGGSIFLDEIGEMTWSLQAKLLRALQEKSFERVGGTQPVKVDVRIITATNRNLEKLVAAKQFREDLFFRISVFPIVIPPLRERKRDIPSLAEWFLEQYSKDLKRGKMNFSPAAVSKLQQYSWPGNVRELQNCIERAVIVSDRNIIEDKDILISSPANIPQQEQVYSETREPGKMHLASLEEEALRNALNRHSGDKTRAAAELGISLRTLYYWLKRYNISTQEK